MPHRRKKKQGKRAISVDGDCRQPAAGVGGGEAAAAAVGAAKATTAALGRARVRDVEGEGLEGKKLKLTTSSKDYAGNLGLPEKVAQRKFETTGQFFRRLDRLVAKAKVEANLESRFDVNLSKKEESAKVKKVKRSSSKLLDSDKIMLESSRKYRDKRRKRYGR